MAYSTIATIPQDELIPVSTINQWGLNEQYLYENNGILDAKVAYSKLTVAGTFSFTSIPTSYDNLIVMAKLRGSSTADNSIRALFRFNNDSGNNYDYQTSGGISALQPLNISSVATVPANTFTTHFFVIADYNSSTDYKSISGGAGTYYNGSTTPVSTGDMNGNWLSAAPITRIDVTPNAGTNFAIGSFVAIFATQSV